MGGSEGSGQGCSRWRCGHDGAAAAEASPPGRGEAELGCLGKRRSPLLKDIGRVFAALEPKQAQKLEDGVRCAILERGFRVFLR